MCVVTLANVPGLRAETPTLSILLEASNIIRERKQHTVFDLVQDTFVARF